MASEQWQRTISPKKPVTFDDDEGLLEIHACFLSSGSKSTLYCSVDSGPRLALASCTSAKPCQHIIFHHSKGKVSLSCDKDELQVLGMVLRTDEAPRKRRKLSAGTSRTEVESACRSGDKQNIKVAPPVVKPVDVKSTQKAAVATEPRAKAAETKQVAAKPAEAKVAEQKAANGPVVLASGLKYEVTKKGSGPAAQRGKTVQVKYEGRLAKNGQRFDRGGIKFRLGAGEVIRGWDEGVKGMLRGEKRRLFIPARLGYGSSGAPPAIPRNADLTFEVELIKEAC